LRIYFRKILDIKINGDSQGHNASPITKLTIDIITNIIKISRLIRQAGEIHT